MLAIVTVAANPPASFSPLSENIIAGSISGIVSGMIVSLALGWINRLNQPLFQLRYISPDLALLSYTGWRPRVFGGSYALERGEVLVQADGFRGARSGIYLDPQSEIVMRTNGLQIGENVSITYRLAPIFPLRKDRKIARCVNWEMGPVTLSGKHEKKEFRGWRQSHLVLKPS